MIIPKSNGVVRIRDSRWLYTFSIRSITFLDSVYGIFIDRWPNSYYPNHRIRVKANRRCYIIQICPIRPFIFL